MLLLFSEPIFSLEDLQSLNKRRMLLEQFLEISYSSNVLPCYGLDDIQPKLIDWYITEFTNL